MNIKKYFSENKVNIFNILITTFFSVVFISLLPVVTMKIIKKSKITSSDIFVYSSVYISAILLFLLFEYLKKVSYVKYARDYGISIKQDLFSAITRMKHSELNQKKTGDFVSSIVNDTELIYKNYFSIIVDFMVSLISSLVYFVYMFNINMVLATVVFLACTVSFFIPKLVGDKLNKKRKEYSDAKSVLCTAIDDLILGKQHFNSESSEFLASIFSKYNKMYEESGYVLGKYTSFTQIVSGFSIYFINIVVFVVGITMVKFGTLTIPEFIATIGFIELVFIPVRDMLFQAILIKSSKLVINKLDYYFENEECGDKRTVSDFKELAVKGLNFQIGECKLENINLVFKRGFKYAIIGDNGSGKSTITKIIANEIEIDKGNVFVDDIDINDLNLTDLLYYAGSSTVFGIGIDENIKLADDDKQISGFAKEIVAGIEDKPCQFLGSNLSMGEKAKISLARSVYADKEIIVLDEIFANIDKKAEFELTKQLLKLDKTIIMVTHNRSQEYLDLFDRVYSL